VRSIRHDSSAIEHQDPVRDGDGTGSRVVETRNDARPPSSPPSGPAQRLFQGHPTQCEFLAADVDPENSVDALVARWKHLRKRFDGRKMITLGEFSGAPNIPLMRRLGVHWAWFASWKGSLELAKRSSPGLIREVYQSEDFITLDDRGALPSSVRK
jgi:hypothetical protein